MYGEDRRAEETLVSVMKRARHVRVAAAAGAGGEERTAPGTRLVFEKRRLFLN